MGVTLPHLPLVIFLGPQGETGHGLSICQHAID